MKTIWVVISGVDFEDCQHIEGCFESWESAKAKAEELKTKTPGTWGNDYVAYPFSGEKVMLPNQWSNGTHYLKILDEEVLP